MLHIATQEKEWGKKEGIFTFYFFSKRTQNVKNYFIMSYDLLQRH